MCSAATEPWEPHPSLSLLPGAALRLPSSDASLASASCRLFSKSYATAYRYAPRYWSTADTPWLVVIGLQTTAADLTWKPVKTLFFCTQNETKRCCDCCFAAALLFLSCCCVNCCCCCWCLVLKLYRCCSVSSDLLLISWCY